MTLVDPYLLLKTIHILSATILFGTGLGTAFHMWLAHLKGDARTIAVVAGNVVLADWLFTFPAVIVQPLSGFALVVLIGYDAFSPGLLIVYALYGLAGMCWIRVVLLQYHIRALARRAAADGHSLPEAYYRAIREWFLLGWPAFLAVLAIFWIMVAKPGWT